MMHPKRDPVPYDPTPKKRSGPTTGAKIVLLLDSDDLSRRSAGALSERLGLAETYVRRVCKALVKGGVLGSETVKQSGTPPLTTYYVIHP